MQLTKTGLVSKLNDMVGRKPAPAAPAPAGAPGFQRDSFLRNDEKQQLSLAMRYGQARLNGHFQHKPDFLLGVKRTDDVALMRKQVEFMAALDGLIANRQKTDITFPKAALLEGIKVTTDAGPVENVGRRLTVPIGSSLSAKQLAEQALHEIF